MPKYKPTEDDKVKFGRTAIGQLVYDLGFAKLTDKWLARKHRIPINQVRALRATVKRSLRSINKSR